MTVEEIGDYSRKDSIQELRKSKKYLDSVDAKRNKFGLLSPITGYGYQNSYDKWRLSYEGPLPDVNFNTVQGWNGNAGLRYFKWYDDDYTKWTAVNLNASYGIAEDRLRFTGSVSHNFNRTNRLRLSLSGGSSVQQFNRSQPISPLINSISTLFFERNYAKFYELTYVRGNYFQEIFNGLRLSASFGYENRKSLQNNTDYVILPQDDEQYTSNNPLLPQQENTGIAAVPIEHNIFKTNISANITFGQKYMTYPNGKYNLGAGKYPRLIVGVENGIGGSREGLDFTHLKARIVQTINLGNIGDLAYNLRGGTFLDGDDISFVDYKHFNGNQTRVGTDFRYTNVFNLMPYYDFSTNKSYFEGHVEHDFKGWILGKIPGINQLNFNLVAGAHILNTSDRKPYTEFSLGLDNIGWGKFRFLRVDYVHSHYNGVSDGAFIFGLKFLDLF